MTSADKESTASICDEKEVTLEEIMLRWWGPGLVSISPQDVREAPDVVREAKPRPPWCDGVEGHRHLSSDIGVEEV